MTQLGQIFYATTPIVPSGIPTSQSEPTLASGVTVDAMHRSESQDFTALLQVPAAPINEVESSSNLERIKLQLQNGQSQFSEAAKSSSGGPASVKASETNQSQPPLVSLDLNQLTILSADYQQIVGSALLTSAKPERLSTRSIPQQEVVPTGALAHPDAGKNTVDSSKRQIRPADQPQAGQPHLNSQPRYFTEAFHRFAKTPKAPAANDGKQVRLDYRLVQKHTGKLQPVADERPVRLSFRLIQNYIGKNSAVEESKPTRSDYQLVSVNPGSNGNSAVEPTSSLDYRVKTKSQVHDTPENKPRPKRLGYRLVENFIGKSTPVANEKRRIPQLTNVPETNQTSPVNEPVKLDPRTKRTDPAPPSSDVKNINSAPDVGTLQPTDALDNLTNVVTGKETKNANSPGTSGIDPITVDQAASQWAKRREAVSPQSANDPIEAVKQVMSQPKPTSIGNPTSELATDPTIANSTSQQVVPVIRNSKSVPVSSRYEVATNSDIEVVDPSTATPEEFQLDVDVQEKQNHAKSISDETALLSKSGPQEKQPAGFDTQIKGSLSSSDNSNSTFTSPTIGVQATSSSVTTRLDSVAAVNSSTRDSIINQVAESIYSEAQTTSDRSSKRITLQINPAELGRLDIHVDSTTDVMRAQIVASEMVTSELLAREQHQLLNSLRELGVEFPELEISYEDPGTQAEQQQGDARRSAKFESRHEMETTDNSKAPMASPLGQDNTSTIDLVA